MTKTRTIEELAGEAAGWFETAKREDGSSFVRTRDGAPEWVADLVREAHGGMLPDDWRYNVIGAALEFIAEGGDDPGEFADDAVDIYTAARLEWLESNLNRAGYCDEAFDEGIAAEPAGIIDRIGAGQYMEASEVFGLVLSFLQRMSDEA